MLLQVLDICEPGRECTPAERAEADRVCAILTEKMRVVHAASGAPGEPTTFYCGWKDRDLHPLDRCE